MDTVIDVVSFGTVILNLIQKASSFTSHALIFHTIGVSSASFKWLMGIASVCSLVKIIAVCTGTTSSLVSISVAVFYRSLQTGVSLTIKVSIIVTGQTTQFGITHLRSCVSSAIRNDSQTSVAICCD